jgi:hypothetical protein
MSLIARPTGEGHYDTAEGSIPLISIRIPQGAEILRKILRFRRFDT